MAVVFTSTIKIGDDDKWYIELKDETIEEETNIEVCFDLDEYEKKIEEMGAEYGGHIDEVKWAKDDDVPLMIIDEIRLQMAERRAELEEKMGENITPVAYKKEEK